MSEGALNTSPAESLTDIVQIVCGNCEKQGMTDMPLISVPRGVRDLCKTLGVLIVHPTMPWEAIDPGFSMISGFTMSRQEAEDAAEKLGNLLADEAIRKAMKDCALLNQPIDEHKAA